METVTYDVYEDGKWHKTKTYFGGKASAATWAQKAQHSIYIRNIRLKKKKFPKAQKISGGAL
jgi:hypothetical protein